MWNLYVVLEQGKNHHILIISSDLEKICAIGFQGPTLYRHNDSLPAAFSMDILHEVEVPVLSEET